MDFQLILSQNIMQAIRSVATKRDLITYRSLRKTEILPNLRRARLREDGAFDSSCDVPLGVKMVRVRNITKYIADMKYMILKLYECGFVHTNVSVKSFYVSAYGLNILDIDNLRRIRSLTVVEFKRCYGGVSTALEMRNKSLEAIDNIWRNSRDKRGF